MPSTGSCSNTQRFRRPSLHLISLLLPISTLLINTGIYVLNNLFDADLDCINGKTSRPIPSGKSLQATWFTIRLTDEYYWAICSCFYWQSIEDCSGIDNNRTDWYPVFVSKGFAKFIIKNLCHWYSYGVFGASIYLHKDLGTDIDNAFRSIRIQTVGLTLYPGFCGCCGRLDGLCYVYVKLLRLR